MADKYINEVGLLAIRNWANGKFALDTELDALDAKVDSIIAEGGEPNVIETVKVNGTALTPDAQKAVNLNGATQEQVTRWYIRDYSDADKILEIVSTNNGVDILSTSNGFDQNDWVKNLVDKNYVDANGGKIDKIKVNGTEQTITNKEVDIEVPTLLVNDGVSRVFNQSDNSFEFSAIQAGLEYTSKINNTTDTNVILASKDYVDTNTATLTKLTNPAGATGTENTYTVAQGDNSAAFNYIKQDGSGGLPNYLNATFGSDAFMLATTNYVDVNGGKIDTIKVNNTTQQILNKTVDIEVIDVDWESDRTKIMKKGGLSSAVEFIENENGVELSFGKGSAQSQTRVYKSLVDKTYVDANFQTDTQVDAKIASAVASAVTIKGSVATASALPATGNKNGDMYDVLDTGKNYVWIVENGTGRWDDYAGTFDLSAYWTSTSGQTNSLIAMTNTEVMAILEPSA